MTALAPLPCIQIDGQSLMHTAIRASAGSGKTFQLANRYLQLIAGGVDPSHILASTFTRVAAGQIRDRILLRLADAAADSAACAELAKFLQADGLTPAAVMRLLRTLALNLHRLNVRTLDSFFASVVNAFALELEIPLGSMVIEEEQAASLRSEAIRSMLDEHQPQKLVDLLRWLTQGGTDRGVTARIESVVNDLYEIHRETPPQAWECVPQVSGRLPPPQLAEAIERMVRAACGSDKRFAAAHRENCKDAMAHNWNEFLKGGLAKAILGDGTYHNKPIDDDLRAAYQPVIDHAKAELVARVRQQTLATRDLLELFATHYERLKAQQGALTFADLNFAMSRAQALGRLDDISFRLDAKLHHMLLDEFQDTSITQWRALEPLAREIVSYRPPERTLFAVGDVKQSIYGWRSAAPEIFDELPNLLRGPGPDGESAIEQRSLAVSYRSSQVVIDVVNAVFGSIDSNPALSGHADAVKAWQAGFATHETAKKKLAGRVELRVCPAIEEGEEARHVRLRQAAELAAELHSRDSSISIAILTRTNAGVARLLYELGPSQLSVPSSGRGGGPLTDAAPVNVILDLLHLADHPDDTVAAFNVAMSPAAALVELADHADRPQRHRVSRNIRRALLEQGYGRVISNWVSALASACDGRELRRLGRLVELADAHDALASGLRASDFIETVEQTKIADVQPAPVQVMTIHQAKGLEFDAVILAELDAALTGANYPPVVFERAGETGPIARICRYMNQEVLQHVPELKGLFERHARRTVRESLSVLYVAMTRAIHGLYMFIDAPKINDNGNASARNMKTLAGVVQCALSPQGASAGAIAFEVGDPDWMRVSEIQTSADLPSEAVPQRIQLAKSAGHQFLRGMVHAPASRAAEQRRFELPMQAQAVRDRGLALHAMFEQVEWLEEFAVDDAALLTIALRSAPRRGQAWAAEQAAAFRKMLKHKQIAAHLSRDAAPSPVHVHREHPFVRIVEGRLQRGKIDRIVVERGQDGIPRAATVIDFKTDQVEASKCAEWAEHYRTQMETYQQAAADFLGLDNSAIKLALHFVEPGVVVELKRPRSSTRPAMSAAAAPARPGQDQEFRQTLFD